MDRFYQIKRSARKTIAIQIKPDGQIMVRCPLKMRTEDVHRFVESKADWIQKHLPKSACQNIKKFTEQELAQFREQTRKLVTARAAFFAPIIGVNYQKITIRAQRTRWGSCSRQGNLNFNCLLALMPPDILDYVVVHELCHRKEMNHSEKFWREVAQVFPDYKVRREWLKAEGNSFMARL